MESTKISDEPVEVEKMKPHLHLCECDLSSIKKWQIGKKYKLVIEVLNKGMNMDSYRDKKEMHADLEVTKIKEEKGKEGMYDKSVVEKATSM